MLVEIQVNKTTEKVYALDENYNVIKQYPCSTAFYAGYNEYGQPHSNPDDGVYKETVWIDLDLDNLKPTNAYGWAYINIDERGRALHGGGSLLDYPQAPYQELVPTEGCIRMHNADIYELAHMLNDARRRGANPIVHVVS